MVKVAFSGEHSSLEDISIYYTDSENALSSYFRIPESTKIPARFYAYNLKEINQELISTKEILDRFCSFEILSTLDARFNLDYLNRCQKKKKGCLSKALQVIYKKKGKNVKLKEEILYTWKKEFPEHKARLDEFGKALDYRNWLAHGRYLQPNKHPHIARFDYLSIYLLAENILTNVDLLEI